MGSVLDEFINQGNVGSEDFVIPNDGFFDTLSSPKQNTTTPKTSQKTVVKDESIEIPGSNSKQEEDDDLDFLDDLFDD